MKHFFILSGILLSIHCRAQLGGLGFAPLIGTSGEGKRFSGNEIRNDLSYGFWAYHEGYGFTLNTQVGLAYLHNTYQYPDTIGTTHTIQRDYIQIVPSFKFWFVNAIRAGNIFGLKCAHKTKIIYNYTFKPYLIFGFPYNFLLNGNNVSEQTSVPVVKHGFSVFGGIGSNIIEMGGNINPKMIFIEFRFHQELKEFITEPSAHPLYGFGFQVVAGLKFEKD